MRDSDVRTDPKATTDESYRASQPTMAAVKKYAFLAEKALTHDSRLKIQKQNYDESDYNYIQIDSKRNLL